MSEIDRSRQAALEALKSASAGRISDALIRSAIDIAYANQFSPDDRSSARRALREAVVREAASRGAEQ